jgi:hypothetical protein
LTLGLRPQNAEELFNLRHSSLRNVVEKSFGIIKGRFAVLQTPVKYPIDFQIKLTYILFALHNAIHITKGGDDADLSFEGRPLDDFMEDLSSDPQQQSNAEADALRDGIAEAMWANYLQVTSHRR